MAGARRQLPYDVGILGREQSSAIDLGQLIRMNSRIYRDGGGSRAMLFLAAILWARQQSLSRRNQRNERKDRGCTVTGLVGCLRADGPARGCRSARTGPGRGATSRSGS